MSLMRPAVAFYNHEDLEFFHLELQRLRRSAMILEAELSQLEAQVRLETTASGWNSLVQQQAQEFVPLVKLKDEMCHSPLTTTMFFHLQNEALEASGMELENTLDQELLVLEEGEDLLCHDLNSVLQASVQQAEEHHILLGVKNQLENEIHDYRRLLEGLEQQW